MTAPVLAALSLGKGFRGRQVLKGASFEAAEGRITAIMGRNGSGKSTLLNLAAGVTAPDFGAVRFRSREWERPRLATMARLGLYYLHAQPPLAARVHVRTYLEAVLRRFGDARAEEAVHALRLESLLDQYPHALSGGEKARVAVGLAMARGPICLLADEPLAGVSPLDQRLLAGALATMAAEGCAVVVAGHDAPALFELVDEVVWVTEGTTRNVGSPGEAERDERFRREYLGRGSADSD